MTLDALWTSLSRFLAPRDLSWSSDGALAHDAQGAMALDRRHPGVAFTPDGRHVVAGGDWQLRADGVVRGWDVATRELAFVLHAPGGELAAMAVDGTTGLLVLALADELVFVHLARREALSLPGGADRVQAAAGKVAYRLHDEEGPLVEVADLASNRIVCGEPVDGWFALSPDGRRLALVAPGERLELWDVTRDPAELLHETEPGAGVRWMAFFGGGARLVTWRASLEAVVTGQAGALAAWTADGEPLGEVAADGGYLVASAPGGERVAIVTRHGEGPDGYELGAEVRIVSLQDAPRAQPLVSWRPGGRSVDRLCFSPDGETLAIAVERTLTLWDVRTGEQRLGPGELPQRRPIAPEELARAVPLGPLRLCLAPWADTLVSEVTGTVGVVLDVSDPALSSAVGAAPLASWLLGRLAAVVGRDVGPAARDTEHDAAVRLAVALLDGEELAALVHVEAGEWVAQLDCSARGDRPPAPLLEALVGALRAEPTFGRCVLDSASFGQTIGWDGGLLGVRPPEPT